MCRGACLQGIGRFSHCSIARRGDVVSADQIRAQLYRRAKERPAGNINIREHVRALRRVLEGSRYLIETYRGIGYELIVRDAPAVDDLVEMEDSSLLSVERTRF